MKLVWLYLIRFFYDYKLKEKIKINSMGNNEFNGYNGLLFIRLFKFFVNINRFYNVY